MRLFGTASLPGNKKVGRMTLPTLARWRTSSLYRSIYKLGFEAKTVKPLIHAQKARQEVNPKPAKFFAKSSAVFQGEQMTQPLALVLYEKLLPGSQLVNRLQDLNYRVQSVSDTSLLVECCEQAKPMLVLADLRTSHHGVCAAIGKLKRTPATQHIPVIAFGDETDPEVQKAALDAGVTLIVSESALLNHLAECLDQALSVE